MSRYSRLKQVKVDNWGIYFLQRLKHFFNRTDYCDLTLQFQDNAQLKVHRLVLNACTEYFEILERTCEMYEDCLIMPEDLQADVVVPIVNFMYTGHLEFKPELLDKLLQTSQIMNMNVLTNLLDTQRKNRAPQPTPTTSHTIQAPVKRSYSKAFTYSDKPKPPPMSPPQPKKTIKLDAAVPSCSGTLIGTHPVKSFTKKKTHTLHPCPTRYDVPEEFATDGYFDDSFSSLSYESRPLMVHPETRTKQYEKKKDFGIFSDSSSSMDIVGSPKMEPLEDSIYDKEDVVTRPTFSRKPVKKDASKLFDQIIQNSSESRISIDSKDLKDNSNIDHAKIISEVLKKYPHLVRGNKSIKLKILDTSANNESSNKRKVVRKQISAEPKIDRAVKVKTEVEMPPMQNNSVYESDVIDSKEAARLISMGAENTDGPWICLICGTPGRAIHFPSYYMFRQHLVEVHKEKPIPNICEYCGLKSSKRTYLLHHLYTKHGIPPPASVKFPKCNQCDYVALSEVFLVKHRTSHTKKLTCNICFLTFKSLPNLMRHIMVTGHKIETEKRPSLQCIYCLKTFARDCNLYTHLAVVHKYEARRDGILEESDSETEHTANVKAEHHVEDSDEETKDIGFKIEQQPDGQTHLVRTVSTPSKQKILNSNFKTGTQSSKPANKYVEYADEELELPTAGDMNVTEEVMPNDEFLPQNQGEEEFYVVDQNIEMQVNTSTSQPVTYLANSSKTQTIVQEAKPLRQAVANHPIQVVVSNEEEIKNIMSSNHSIIFDAEGNATKTLAVLTTPHSAELNANTTIDLENAGASDVMILPDDYQLNEAVATSNGNIVVVYSDQLQGDNKYIVNTSFGQQLVSTNAHFIPTTSIITNNFEPSTSAQASIVAWHRDVPPEYQNQMNVISTCEETVITSNMLEPTETSVDSEADAMMQSEDQTEQVTESQEEDSNDVAVPVDPNIPLEIDGSIPMEVHIQSADDVDESPMMASLGNQESIEPNQESQESSEQPYEEIVEEPEHEQMETSDSVTQETEHVTEQDVEEQTELELEPTNEVETEPTVEENDATEVEQETQDIENEPAELEHESTSGIEEALPEIETPHEEMESELATETSSEQEPEIVEEQHTDLPESVINNEVAVITPAPKPDPAKALEQIQNLTWEWSDDENSPNVRNAKISPNEESGAIEDESIENIQQEVEKHVQEQNEQNVVQKEPEPELAEDTEPEEVEDIQQPDKPIDVNKQIKLNSLLNDWDDSDSPANTESPATTSNGKEVSAEENSDANIDETDPIVADVSTKTVVDVKPKEDIKNLVSDWSEDEEVKED